MRFEIESRIVLRLLNEDGTKDEIVGVARAESFEGVPSGFKSHYQMVGYEIDRRLDEEFDKVFPPSPKPPKLEDDEIPF